MSKKPPESPKNDTSQPQGRIFFSALGMGLGTLVSRLLGFLRDILLFWFFPKVVTDAFVLGFKIPNVFRRVMGEGALAVSFIPRYLELKEKDPEKAKTLKNVVFTFLFTLSTLIVFFGILYMPKILHFLVSLSGKSEAFSNPENMAFAIRMSRWMFFYTFLVTQFAYLMAVLNAHKRFLIAGLAPAFFNLGFVIMVLVPNSFVSFSGFQLALGVLFGGALQVLVVGYDHVKHIGWPKFNFNFSFKPFKKVLISTLPGIAGVGVLQFISIINISLCAQFGLGSLGFLYMADRLLELPQSLIAVSLGTALLPNLSELWVKDRSEFDKTLSQTIRLYLFFALPSAVGLVFMALPIIQLLFQRGDTSFQDALQVASLVQVYGGVLVISGINKMLLPIYYSVKNTWYPATLSIFIVTSHYFFGQVFIENFGLTGVVITTLLSTALNFSFLLLGLKFFIGRSYIEVVLNALKSFILPSAALALSLWFITMFIPTDKSALFYIYTICTLLAAVIVYFGTCFIFRVGEVVYLKALFRKLGLKI